MRPRRPSLAQALITYWALSDFRKSAQPHLQPQALEYTISRVAHYAAQASNEAYYRQIAHGIALPWANTDNGIAR